MNRRRNARALGATSVLLIAPPGSPDSFRVRMWGWPHQIAFLKAMQLGVSASHSAGVPNQRLTSDY
jgi:hypothetical protein